MTMTMVGLNPRPVHPSTSVSSSSPCCKSFYFKQRVRRGRWDRCIEEGEPVLLSPDDLEEGGRNWFSRIWLEPPSPKKKKKPYKPKPKVKSPVSIGGVNKKGFGPPPS
jgi:hypothetical protein